MDETLDDTLKEAQVKRHRQKQGVVGIETPIIMADTLLHKKVKIFLQKLCDVEAIKLLYTSADTIGKKLNTWRKNC